MAETRYGKYFVTEPKPGDDHHIDNEFVKFPIYVDQEVVPGAHYFMAASFSKVTGRGAPPHEHTHPYDEYLVFLGSNHEDPRDLGGEVEIFMDGERHVITKSCAVFVPAGVKHAPINFLRIDTPIWYLATSPVKQYEVPREVLEKLKKEE